MKTIGLLGGMSWESTREYYRLINESVRERLGGLHSAEIILASVDFAPLSAAMNRGDWPFIRSTLEARTRSLAAAGAEMILICTNTMHKLADTIAAAAAPVPLIHIGQCSAEAAKRGGFTSAALLGTRFTMEEDFYTSRLQAAGLKVLLPTPEERQWLDNLIFQDLCAGVFRSEARAEAAGLIGRLGDQGAEAVILGCTELPLIISPDESPLPLIDTTRIHAAAAVETALEP